MNFMEEPQVVYAEPDFAVVLKPAGWLTHPARRAENGTQNTEHRAQSTEHGTRNTEHRAQSTEHGTQNTEHGARLPAGRQGAGSAEHRTQSKNGGEISGEVNKEPTLTAWLTRKYPEVKTVGDDPAWRPGIVHRLDRDTAGLLIIPRSQASFEYFKDLFQRRQITKTYFAVVRGIAPARGVIDRPIGVTGTVKRSVRAEKFVKPAVTRYRLLASLVVSGEPASLLEVRPETGRTHQIRVHLAAIAHPVVGDKLYGRRKKSPLTSAKLLLFAAGLEFVSPHGRKLRIEAAPPDFFPKAEF